MELSDSSAVNFGITHEYHQYWKLLCTYNSQTTKFYSTRFLIYFRWFSIRFWLILLFATGCLLLFSGDGHVSHKSVLTVEWPSWGVKSLRPRAWELLESGLLSTGNHVLDSPSPVRADGKFILQTFILSPLGYFLPKLLWGIGLCTLEVYEEE